MRSRFQPKLLRWDTTSLCGSEQRAGDHRIGLGYAAIKLITKVLAQRLRVAADDPGDVDLRDTETRQGPHPLAHRISHDEWFSRHVRLLTDCGPACRRGRRRIDRRLDA